MFDQDVPHRFPTTLSNLPLVAAHIAGQPTPRTTAEWLAAIADELHERLARAGLVAPRAAAPPTTLGAFLNHFIDNRRPTAAANTITNLAQAARRLVEHFGEDRFVAHITPADAETWAARLNARYAPATTGRTIKRARQFFKAAVRDGLIAKNPFAEVKASRETGTGDRIPDPRRLPVDRQFAGDCGQALPDGPRSGL